MQNAKANPGSVVLNLSSFVSFQIFYIEISSFKYCLAQFLGNSSRYCNKNTATTNYQNLICYLPSIIYF